MKLFTDYYNTEIIIGTQTQSNGFFDDDAYSFNEIGRVMADVQPYSGEMALKEYGITDGVRLRAYFGDSGGVASTGRYAKIKETLYQIVYHEKWESGEMILLKHIEG